jgi:hypothetical protein
MGLSKHSVPNATFVFPQALPNGGSAPRVCDFDDMVFRLVKWHPSNHGITSTYSELVASRLGQLIDAPVVRGTVVHIDMDLLPPEIAARVTQPFHVGFTYSSGQNFAEADYAGIKNTAALPAAAVLLAWLQVGDQESHNQYLYQLEQVLPDKTTRRMNHFILVDLAAVCGQHDWSNHALDNPGTPHTLPKHMQSRVKMDDVGPVLEVVNGLAEEDIRECCGSYPASWGIGDGLTKKLAKYVLDRRHHLAAILQANLTARTS